MECERGYGDVLHQQVRIDRIDGDALIPALDRIDGLPVVEATGTGTQYRCIANASTLEHWRRAGASAAPALIVDAVPYAVTQLELRGPHGVIAARLQTAEIVHVILSDRMRAYGQRFEGDVESFVKSITAGVKRNTHQVSNPVRYDDEADIIFRLAATVTKNKTATSGLNALNNLIRLHAGLDRDTRSRLMEICSLDLGNTCRADTPSLPPLTITAVEKLGTIAKDRQGAVLEEALASDDPPRYVINAATKAGQDAKQEAPLTPRQVRVRLSKAIAGLDQLRSLLDDPSLGVSAWANIGSTKGELTRIIKRLHQLMASPSSADGAQTEQLPLFLECRNEH